jgi:hypothetical protein
MTIDALHGPVDRPLEHANAGPAIGAADANIFLCPRCTRPLAVGVSKCAGCNTRLVAGVPLLKFSGFVGLGLLLGLALGGGIAGAVMLTSQPVAVRIAAPPAAAIPSAAPAASGVAAPSVAPGPSVATVDPAIPPAALTALRQSTTVNQRLLSDADLLATAMTADAPSPAEIAPLLRSLASTAAYGDRIATSVGTWDEATDVSAALATFYGSIDRIADDGLAASVTNDRAYRDAGRRMLTVLDGLPGLDAAARRLAATVDVDLPPLVPAP